MKRFRALCERRAQNLASRVEFPVLGGDGAGLNRRHVALIERRAFDDTRAHDCGDVAAVRLELLRKEPDELVLRRVGDAEANHAVLGEETVNVRVDEAGAAVRDEDGALLALEVRQEGLHRGEEADDAHLEQGAYLLRLRRQQIPGADRVRRPLEDRDRPEGAADLLDRLADRRRIAEVSREGCRLHSLGFERLGAGGQLVGAPADNRDLEALGAKLLCDGGRDAGTVTRNENGFCHDRLFSLQRFSAHRISCYGTCGPKHPSRNVWAATLARVYVWRRKPRTAKAATSRSASTEAPAFA